MRLTFRTDILDRDEFGHATGRRRAIRKRLKQGVAVRVEIEILVPFKRGGVLVWWPVDYCDTFDAPDWRLDEQGRLVHSAGPRALPPVPRKARRVHARNDAHAATLHEVVEVHITRPTLHTVGRIKLLADSFLDDGLGLAPKSVTKPTGHVNRAAYNDRLRAAAYDLVLDPGPATYQRVLDLAWLTYEAAEATLMRAREQTPTRGVRLHDLYARYPHRTQFADADDPRIPGACQWPNPQDEQRARANLTEDLRQMRAEARAKKLAERKGRKA